MLRTNWQKESQKVSDHIPMWPGNEAKVVSDHIPMWPGNEAKVSE